MTLFTDRPVARERYATLLVTLWAFRPLLDGKRVLDFGASSGLSMVALVESGARYVVGVEPDLARVERGRLLLKERGLDDRTELHHVPDTTHLPLADGSVEVVMANAVLEHVPQPRGPYIRELWRVLAPGGYLIVNETPNKYLPRDYHTTRLWFVNWLPRKVAFWYAVWRGRFKSTGDWDHSGWRGLGFYELTAHLRDFVYLPEASRLRHRLLTRVGLPASLIDPYPTLVFRKRQPQ